MFIKRLGLKSILSFADCPVELRSLHVLMGPNGSGKSNLIHVIDLIRHLSDLCLRSNRFSRGCRAQWREPHCRNQGI